VCRRSDRLGHAGGHFIPEQLPDETAAALQAFMD
jgi:hypothetical protein